MDCFSLEDGTDRLSRNVGKKTTILCCVKSNKSGDLKEILLSRNTDDNELHELFGSK
jgi:hypothetical protein